MFISFNRATLGALPVFKGASRVPSRRGSPSLLGHKPELALRASSKRRTLGSVCTAGTVVAVAAMLMALLSLVSAGEAEAQVSGSGPRAFVSRSVASVAEDAADDARASFIFRLSEESTADATVSFSVDTSVSGAAPRGEYELSGVSLGSLTGSVVIPAGTIEQRVILMPNRDINDEPDGTVMLRSTSCNGCSISGRVRRSASITIVDDDDPPVLTVERVASSPMIAEGGRMDFRVSLSPASKRTVDASFSRGPGSTAVNSDVTLRHNNTELSNWGLRFDPGDTSKTITLEADRDSLDETSEVMILDFFRNANSSYYSVTPEGSRALVWIRDADETNLEAGIIRKGRLKMQEGESKSFSVFLLGDRQGSMTVPFNVDTTPRTINEVEGHDVVSTSDYTLSLSSPLRFAANEFEKVVTLDAVDDDVYERSEIAEIELEPDAEDAYNVLSDADSVFIRIDDNGDPPPVASIRRSGAVSAAEGQRNNRLAFTVSLSTTAGGRVVVYYDVASASVAKNPDFVEATRGSVTFEPGEQTKQVFLTAKSDGISEAAEERVEIELRVESTRGYSRSQYSVSPTHGSAVVGWIHDAGFQAVKAALIHNGATSVAEGEVVSFQVALIGSSQSAVTVPYTVDFTDSAITASPRDFSLSPSRSVTFPAGESEMTVDLNLEANDGYEPDELLKLKLAAPVSGSGYSLSSGSDLVTLTITNGDAVPVASISEVSASSVSEGYEGTFKISLNEDPGQTVPVRFGLSEDSAALSSDIVFSPDGEVALTPDEPASTVRFTVVVDDVGESMETAVIELLAEPDIVAEPRFAIDPDTGSTEISIAESIGAPVVSITSSGNGHVQEGEDQRFTVQLSGPTANPLRVDFEVEEASTSASPMEYALLDSGFSPLEGLWVDFVPGGILAKTFIVRAIDDTSDEASKNLVFRLAPGDGYVVDPDVSRSKAAVTIADNDYHSMVSITGGGPVAVGGSVSFAVALSASSSLPTAVSFDTTGSTAPSSDYSFSVDGEEVSGSVTFAPGELLKTLVMATENASAASSDASDVSVVVNLDSQLLIPDASVGSATAWIRYSGSVPVASVSTTSPVAVEGSTRSNGSFKVKLSEAPAAGSSVRVSYAVETTASPSEYRLAGTLGRVSGVVVFRPGDDLEETITLVGIEDGHAEASHDRVRVILSAGPAYAVNSEKGSAVAWIRDVASRSLEASISRNGPIAVSEGQARSFSVSLAGPAHSVPVAVGFSVVSETVDPASDYSLSHAGLVVIPVGKTAVDVTLLALDDLIYEPDEFAQIVLQPGDGYSVSSAEGAGSASVVIVDVDAEPVASIVRLGASSVKEGQLADFAVSLDIALQDYMYVRYFWSGGSSWVWFSPGETHRMVSVLAVDDGVAGPDRLLTVSLWDWYGYSVDSVVGSASVTVVDASVPVASIERVGSQAMAEDVDRDFEVSLSFAPGHHVTVDVGVVAASTDAELVAAGGSGDFALPVPASVTFAPGEVGPKTFTVTMHGDSVLEAAEQVAVGLLEGDFYEVSSVESEAVALVELTDDDALPVASITGVGSIGEDAGSRGGGFTISLTGASELPIRVYYRADTASSATSPAEATAGDPADYGLSPSGFVVFPAGANAPRTDLRVGLAPVDDDLHETDEAVAVFLFSGPRHRVDSSAGEATVVITDDDSPPEAVVELFVDSDSDGRVDDLVAGGVASVSEGDRVAFRVRLLAGSGRVVSVPYGLAGAGSVVSPAVAADFSPVSAVAGTAVFEPGMLEYGPVEFAVRVDDATESPEPYETARIVLAGDADTADPSYRVSASAGSVDVKIAEHAGWQPVASVVRDGAELVREGSVRVFRFKLSGASSAPVEVRFGLDGNQTEALESTDAATRDFSLSAESPLRFAAGVVEVPVTLTAHGDEIDELFERVTLQVLADSAADPGDAAYLLGAGVSAYVRIEDTNPAPTASVTSAGAVTEGSQVAFAVSLSGRSSRDVAVRYELAPASSGVSGDAGYGLSPAGSVTVPAGQLTAPPVTLRVADDGLFELDQTVALRLLAYNGGATPALYAVAGAPAGASAVVISDDDPEPVVSVEAPAAFSEGSGGSFTVRLDRFPLRSLTVPFSVAVTQVAGASLDYTVSPRNQVVFGPNEKTKSIVVDTTAETPAVAERNQQLTVTLADSGAHSSYFEVDPEHGSAAVTVRDDVAAGSVSLGFDTVAQVHEGGQLRFKVSVSEPVAGTQALVVDYQVAAVGTTAVYGSDYTLAGSSPQAVDPTAARLAGSVRIAPGAREAYIVLHAENNTGQDAPDETVALRLTGTSRPSDYLPGIADVATATIYDGPPPVASVTYHKTANPPRFTISLDTQADRDITVNYTASGTGITPGNRQAPILFNNRETTVTLADLGIAGAPPSNLTLTLTSCAANACTISTTRPSDGE